MRKRLTRSSTDRLVAGVCGGLGEYFGIDSTWIRLLFVALTPFSYFTSIIVYIVCVMFMPENRNVQRTHFRSNVNDTLHRLNHHINHRESRRSHKDRK